MVHVPTETRVTVAPLTVHTDAVSDEKLTGKPDDAVALTVNGAAPNVLLLKDAKVMVCPKLAMVMANVCVASGGKPLVAVSMLANVPCAVGVPAMSPLVPFSDRPVGRLLANAEKVGVGVPLAVTAKLYGTLIMPFGGAALVKSGA